MHVEEPNGDEKKAEDPDPTGYGSYNAATV
jgi:hypothetical protein